MSRRLFDTKCGAALLGELPTGPGIYVFRDDQRAVLYVGKAKNLRRRLQGYRNASRRRTHRKVHRLLREAQTLEVRALGSEREALLEENTLIRTLRPAHNVDGAFAFLYPAIGLGWRDGHTLLCFSTRPADYSALELQWFGTFRSRPRAREAFDALIEWLALVCHHSPRTQLPAHPSRRGSRLVGLRQLPRDLADQLGPFVAGEDRALLPALALALLAKPRARRDAAHIEECLRRLDHFYDVDTRRLHLTLNRLGRPGPFVPQDERDALFIEARFDVDKEKGRAR
jgi:excinuclease ABC subunit C